MSTDSAWEEAHDADARALFVGGAPPLSGEAARAAVELLWAMADAIDHEYAREIERDRASSMPSTWRRDPEAPWRPVEPERQLRLDLGADDPCPYTQVPDSR